MTDVSARETRCDVHVSVETAPLAIERLTAAGFTVAPGDPELIGETVNIPLAAVRRWSPNEDLEDKALLLLHEDKARRCLKDLALECRYEGFSIRTEHGGARWLSVVRTSTMADTGTRILALDEADVDAQLRGLALMLGEPRGRFTVRPLPGWGKY